MASIYSDRDGDEIQESFSPYSSSPSDESDIDSPARCGPSSLDQVVNNLFSFDTRGIKNKRSRAPFQSDDDKAHPSKQRRSSLPCTVSRDKLPKADSRTGPAQIKTPNRTPQPLAVRKNPLSGKAAASDSRKKPSAESSNNVPTGSNCV